MSEEIVSASGASQEASGDQGAGTQSKADDQVKYTTYQKVLTEKKNTQDRLREAEAKLADYENSQREAQETRLKEQNEYKALFEQREQELADTKQSLSSLTGQIDSALKRNSFLEAIEGSIPSKYHSFINVDSIIKNPDTGEVDEMSVAKEVERFKNQYPELIKVPHKAASTNVYPTGDAGNSGPKSLSDLAMSGSLFKK